MNYSDTHKMTVIININMMRNKIGLKSLDIDNLFSHSYEFLHDMQNSLIKHYNEALKNTPKK